MDHKIRGYLTISMTALAILLCGYGVGHLMGEKAGKTESASQSVSWPNDTLSRLEKDLSLDPAQTTAAEKVIQKAAEERSRSLLRIYDHLAPELNEEQRAQLKKLLLELHSREGI